jgi:DNA-binding NtrC family response regulator
MSAERAESIGSIKDRRPSKAFTHRPPRPIKIAKQSRVGRLVDLTNNLLREIETLALDQASTDETGRVQTRLLTDGIDLSQEVKRFEINLIKLALNQTRGNQARAARLLNIKPTTLNAKIKVYGIDY